MRPRHSAFIGFFNNRGSPYQFFLFDRPVAGSIKNTVQIPFIRILL